MREDTLVEGSLYDPRVLLEARILLRLPRRLLRPNLYVEGPNRDAQRRPQAQFRRAQLNWHAFLSVSRLPV